MNRAIKAIESTLNTIKHWYKDVITKYRVHIVLWTLYAIYESIIVGFISGVFGDLGNYVIHYSLNISLFYIHSWLLGEVKLKNQPIYYITVLLLVLVEMACYVISIATLNHFFTIYNQANQHNNLGIDKAFILRAVYRSLFFIILGTAYWYLRRFLKERQKNQELEEQKLRAIIENQNIAKALVQAENAFIRAQINPHFLFNTLGFVHRRIRETDQDAGEIIIALAKLMRYTFELDQNLDFSPLVEEIEQVENLINLFQLRDNYSLSIHFDFNEEAKTCKMIPLVLLTLCENVFKHGILNDESFPASIMVNADPQWIKIKTENKISGVLNSLSSRTGLRNLKERLEQQYLNDFTFTTKTENNVFIANLEIPYKCMSTS